MESKPDTKTGPNTIITLGTREWIIVFIALLLFLNYGMISTLRQLPSPLYGGDYWNHLGMIYHIYYGGSLFENGQMAGEIPWVPWLYHALVAVLARLTSLDPMGAVVWFNLLLIPASAWIFYRIAARFTSNPVLIVAGMLPLLALYPIFKYTDFAFLVVAPALFLAWLRYRENPDRNNTLLLAVAMIVANLTSAQLLIADYIVLALVAGSEIYRHWAVSKRLDTLWNAEGIAKLRPYALVFLVSLLGSLLYWYAPLFIYRGSTPNDLFIYGWADFTKFGEQINFFFAVIGNWFLPGFSAPGVYHLALLAGAVLLVKSRNESKAHEMAFLFLAGALIGASHHFITFNLFHFHFDPGRPFQMLEMSIAGVELALVGEWLQRRLNSRHIAWAFLLITALMFSDYRTALARDDFYLGAQQPLAPAYVELQQWTVANTGVNDAFLTDNEDAFLLNGLTGRKSVSYRRTHAPIYTDMNQRMMDAAVMLYGTDNATRMELLKKYKVKYVFWTLRWFDNQYRATTEGAVVGFFDPFMVPSRPGYQDYLQANGVQMVQTRTYLDPAYISNYPIYDVVVAMPSQGDLFHPWNSDLEQRMREVKRIEIENNGQRVPFFIIYEVQYD